MVLAPSFFSCGKPGDALACNVQNVTVLYAMAAVRPPEADVHLEVKRPERLAALGLTPHDNDAEPRDKTGDDVCRHGPEQDFTKRCEPKSGVVVGSAVFALPMLPLQS